MPNGPHFSRFVTPVTGVCHIGVLNSEVKKRFVTPVWGPRNITCRRPSHIWKRRVYAGVYLLYQLLLLRNLPVILRAVATQDLWQVDYTYKTKALPIHRESFQNTFTAKLLMVFNRIKDHIYIKSYQEKWVVLIFNGLDFPWFLNQRILRFHRIVGLVSFRNWII